MVFADSLDKVKLSIRGGEWEPKPARAMETFAEFGDLELLPDNCMK